MFLQKHSIVLLLLSFIAPPITAASATLPEWELIADDGSVTIDNNAMLELAVQSSVIYQLLARHLDAGQILTLETLDTIARTTNTLRYISINDWPHNSQAIRNIVTNHSSFI